MKKSDAKSSGSRKAGKVRGSVTPVADELGDRMFPIIGGTITATHSEGIFAIKDQQLQGWLARRATDGLPGKPAETSERVHWFASPEESQ